MIRNQYNTKIGKIKTYFEKKHPKLLERFILPMNMLLVDRLFLIKSRHIAKKYLNQKQYPLFQTIEIETINRCNGKCSFCPINRNIDPRPFKLMDEKLFESIIQQLKKINYRGYIGLYSNNEPLLDKRIFSFLQKAREALPNANLYLFTNGTLLTIEKFDELMKYLDWITIDNYNDNLELIKPVEEVHNYIKTKPYKNKVYIYLRKENEILLNRSGQSKNRTKNKMKLKSTCLYPFEQVVVRPDGKLSLCCNDATGKVTMGDINENSLLDIWRGKKYDEIRKKMIKDRKLNGLCKDCDSVTLKVDPGTIFKFKNISKLFKKKNVLKY